MGKALEYILTKFPNHRAKIVELYNKEEDFRILTGDYLTSVQTLLECRLDVTKNKEFENEFLQVYLDLEKEISHLLEHSNK